MRSEDETSSANKFTRLYPSIGCSAGAVCHDFNTSHLSLDGDLRHKNAELSLGIYSALIDIYTNTHRIREGDFPRKSVREISFLAA
ncbi:hypothetical protein [Enterovibrio calviensis]|uniref:hypothetical protein n=1 Tax=Enterovibrio calviensis TaxID=91359 RepID=UPI0012DDC8DD|nr:hypothetical protein [Enterovibrio calviensis]